MEELNDVPLNQSKLNEEENVINDMRTILDTNANPSNNKIPDISEEIADSPPEEQLKLNSDGMPEDTIKDINVVADTDPSEQKTIQEGLEVTQTEAKGETKTLSVENPEENTGNLNPYAKLSWFNRQETRLKTKICIDDVTNFIEKMKKKVSHDTQVLIIPSNSACRFELPIDMTRLEEMNPLSYLTKHCHPTTARRKIYNTKFGEENASTLRVNELQGLYEDLFLEKNLADEMLFLRRLLDMDLNHELDLELFTNVSCLMERIVLKCREQKMSSFEKNVFEVADFCSLNGKIAGVDVPSSLKVLLEFIRS